jgi:uncharacterized protein YeaO (DUF488 family)
MLDEAQEGPAMILIKRVYEAAEPADGVRFLVDRLWPRGVKKTSLSIKAWLKDVAPSDELRRWYHQDLERWPQFRSRYFAELEQRPQAWHSLLEAARSGNVTLLFSARPAEHNNAVALREFLKGKLGKEKKG